MKKALALVLAALMFVTLTACKSSPKFSGDVTLKVMLMPQSDMNADITTKVTEAVNARIAELGYKFKVEFSWSGGAWGFDNLDTALQTGSAPDIFPAHTWSGSVTYTVGAQTGQYLRLDDPKNDLLKELGKDLYAKTSPAIKAAATVPGDNGTGIYAYIIEKDSVSQLGYLVNKTVLEEIGFTIDDFKADDLASWEPILAAYKAAYPDKYPLNIESEVLDRTVNHIAFVDDTNGPLGVSFNNAKPGDTKVTIASRYESAGYKSFLETMRGYYNAQYVDPDQGVVGDVSKNSVANRRISGDFLISTYVYAPGGEITVTDSATAAQGKPVEIVWAPGWSSPIATTETALGAGLAVGAGTKYAPEAVVFLNMLASDTKMGNLVSEGLEGECYTLTNNTDILDAEGNPTGEKYANNIPKRTGDRAGWNIWRYGVVGATSAATPLADIDRAGKEWENLKTFNGAAAALEHTGWLFDVTNVDAANSACLATIDKYAVPLGSGVADPAQYDAFIAELKANGLDSIVSEAASQYSAWKTDKG